MPVDLEVKQGLNKKNKLKLKSGSQIFLMGICGTAMASLALHLKKEGYLVSGSDVDVYPPMSSLLEEAGIVIKKFNKKNISKNIDLIIVGNVMRSTHEEVQEMFELNLAYLSFPDYLKQTLLKDKKNIVIAGTHGKSTSTALMAYVAKCLDKKAGYFIGGKSRMLSSSLKKSESSWFILEGDEYDTAFFAKHPKFFYYNPMYLILTHLEFDHGDIYSDINELIKVFRQLISSIPKEGKVVAFSGNNYLETITKTKQASLVTFGFNKTDDYQIKNIQLNEEGSEFEILHKNKSYLCKLRLFGISNILNAVGCFALAHQLNWSASQVIQALSGFETIERRLQKQAENKEKNQVLFEDFAHHPTAVKLTLKSLRLMYPERRILACFEPRSWTSRSNVFQKDYAKSLALADVVATVEPHDTSRIEKSRRFSSDLLKKDLESQGVKVIYQTNGNQLYNEIVNNLKQDDVIVVMSNGSFDGLLNQLKKALI